MQNTLIKILNILSSISKKKVIYINNGYANENNLAVKTKFGFWYCGNVFNYSDIAYGFASRGIVEDFDMGIVKQILKTSDQNKTYAFYDLGCNTGPYSLLAASSRENTKVNSFDPIREHLNTLGETIKLNRYENIITLHELGLSNVKKEATLHLSGSGSTFENDFLANKTPTRVVQLDTFDSYITTHNLPAPDFMKIDVEGHEYKLLLGAKDSISKSLPILFIEIAKTLKNIGSKFEHKEFEKIFEMLSDINYKVFIVKDNKLHEFKTSDIEDGVFMFLFLHKDKHLSLIDSLAK